MRLEKKKEMAVAKLIEFYVPNRFRRSVKWVSPEQRGRVIELGAANIGTTPAGPGAGDFRDNTTLEKVVHS
jgi:hypothetical protein